MKNPHEESHEITMKRPFSHMKSPMKRPFPSIFPEISALGSVIRDLYPNVPVDHRRKTISKFFPWFSHGFPQNPHKFPLNFMKSPLKDH